MKQFLMLVSVAAVAGAMYVAGASGSQQTKFAPESQVVALQKKVKALSNLVNKEVAPAAIASATVIGDCWLNTSGTPAKANGLGVTEFGTTSSVSGQTGFLFGATNTGATSVHAALDVDTGASPAYDLQEVTPACVAGNLATHRLAQLAARMH